MGFRHIKFANLPVTDQDRALAFYRDKVGLQLVLDDATQGPWRWIEFAILGAVTGLVMEKRANATPANEPCLILVCDDAADECTRLAAAGVEIVSPAQPAPWAKGEIYALFRDSEGNLIMLGQKAS